MRSIRRNIVVLCQKNIKGVIRNIAVDLVDSLDAIIKYHSHKLEAISSGMVGNLLTVNNGRGI